MLSSETGQIERVSALTRPERVAWAAGAAELLLPTASRLPMDVLPEHEWNTMRRELDLAWAVAEANLSVAVVETDVQRLIPDVEIDGFGFHHGMLQNVAAAVVYATWCAASGDAQHAVWAWRQVDEIVDLAAGARFDQGSNDRTGLPDVPTIVDTYLSMLEGGSVAALRSATRTRSNPLSLALHGY